MGDSGYACSAAETALSFPKDAFLRLRSTAASSASLKATSKSKERERQTTQSALIQDLDPGNIATTRRNTRLLAYDLRHRKPKLVGEYVVQLPLYQDQTTTQTRLLTAAQSEFLALNDHQFLVLARDSSVEFTTSSPASVYRSVDLIDISDATNIAGSAYDQPGQPGHRLVCSTGR
jgi:hypothetical protein